MDPHNIVDLLSDRKQTDTQRYKAVEKKIRKTQLWSQDFFSSQPPRIAEIKAVFDSNIKGKH
jgi:hypothetical protein